MSKLKYVFLVLLCMMLYGCGKEVVESEAVDHVVSNAPVSTETLEDKGTKSVDIEPVERVSEGKATNKVVQTNWKSILEFIKFEYTNSGSVDNINDGVPVRYWESHGEYLKANYKSKSGEADEYVQDPLFGRVNASGLRVNQIYKNNSVTLEDDCLGRILVAEEDGKVKNSSKVLVLQPYTDVYKHVSYRGMLTGKTSYDECVALMNGSEEGEFTTVYYMEDDTYKYICGRLIDEENNSYDMSIIVACDSHVNDTCPFATMYICNNTLLSDITDMNWSEDIDNPGRADNVKDVLVFLDESPEVVDDSDFEYLDRVVNKYWGDWDCIQNMDIILGKYKFPDKFNIGQACEMFDLSDLTNGDVGYLEKEFKTDYGTFKIEVADRYFYQGNPIPGSEDNWVYRVDFYPDTFDDLNIQGVKWFRTRKDVLLKLEELKYGYTDQGKWGDSIIVRRANPNDIIAVMYMEFFYDNDNNITKVVAEYGGF